MEKRGYTSYLIPVVILVTLVLIGGCSQTPPGAIADVKDAKYQAGSVFITVEASESSHNVRIDILGTQGQILCTKYKDLAVGTNQLEFSDCQLERDIKVSVSPPEKPVVIRDFRLDLPEPGVKIKNANYETGNLVITLDSNIEIKNARIEIVSEGNVLCTKYVDLKQGENQIRLPDCGVEEKITISVTPSGGTLVTKDFMLPVPLLKLQKGYRYDYNGGSSGSLQEISIYITEETADEWQGIAGIKRNGNTASILRFKIRKSDLNMQATYPLAANKITAQDVEYKSVKDISSIGEAGNSLIPFWFLVWKGAYGLNLDDLFDRKIVTFSQSSSEQITFKVEDTLTDSGFLTYKISITGTEADTVKSLGEIYASPAEPYLIVRLIIFEGGGGSLIYKKMEKDDFSLSDYSGYNIEDYKVAVEVTEQRAVPAEQVPATGSSIFDFNI